MDVRYPHINVPLVGEDGNAWSILARCNTALKRNGLADQCDSFRTQAMAGDYDHLLRTVMEWFAVDENLSDDYEDDWDTGFGSDQWLEEYSEECPICYEENCTCDDEDEE